MEEGKEEILKILELSPFFQNSTEEEKEDCINYFTNNYPSLKTKKPDTKNN